MKNHTEQEKFWAEIYALDYIIKNSEFNSLLGIEAWNKMLANTKYSDISSILKCGCNIGRNIEFLNVVIPDNKKS
jgi:hypothetical protein